MSVKGEGWEGVGREDGERTCLFLRLAIKMEEYGMVGRRLK